VRQGSAKATPESSTQWLCHLAAAGNGCCRVCSEEIWGRPGPFLTGFVCRSC